ncbi:MAG: aminodeoxychorismate synthase, component I, partial [Allosphingosinicella sp.]
MTKQVSPDAPANGPASRFWQAGEPFVLLQFDGQARLYRGPVEVVEARRPDEIVPALERLRGRHAAGFIAYEAGHGLEPRLAPLARPVEADGPPLLWFGLFEGFEEVDPAALLPDPAGAWAAPPRPLVERAAHEA